MLFFFMTLAGVLGFNRLNIQNLPDLDLPTIQVELIQPGAAPAQLETEVARKVEDSMATLQGLKHLRTNITDGRVSMTAEFQLGRPLADALLDVKDAVDKVRSALPADVQEPQVSKVTVAPDGALLTYAVANSELSEEALSWFVDDELGRAVMGVPGVTSFTRVGGVQREVQVTVNPTQMAALGVTASDISRALRQAQQDASGGRGQLGGAEQGVRTLATVRKAQDLAALPIALANGRFLRLDQVAMVKDTIAERQQAALLDGHAAVGFQVSRTKGFDEKKIADGVAGVAAELEQRYPGTRITLVRSTVDATMEQYKGSMEMLIEGALLAVVVIWWFLRDWRSTFIGAVALPLSIIPTFAVMQWFGFSLNTITLLALAVVVGILVDDAVVEVENISRHVRQGKSVREATIDAVNEIALAVIATTSTMVVVFLPTAIMSGIPGLVFKQFGWTVVAAVITSLLVARLVTPMMAVWLLKPGHREPPEGRLLRRYVGWVRWCLSHRKTTVLGGVGFFLASLSLVPLLPTSFVPAQDRGSIEITLELPPGANLDTTLRTAEEIRQALKGVPGIKAVFTTIGNAQASSHGGPVIAGEVRKGSLTLVLVPRGERPRQQEIERMIRPRLEQIAGARLALGGGAVGEKLQILLASQDAKALKSTAQAIERDLRALPFLSGVISTASLERPEVTVRPDAARAAERGVNTQTIGETLRIALSGDFDAALSKLNLDSRQIDIRVQVPHELRQDLQAIGDLRVPARQGLVPLSSIADLTVESGPSQIDRYNRERQVTLTADLGGYPIGKAIKERDALPSVQSMPASVKLMEAGDTEVMIEMMAGFGMALLIGVLLIYAVLVMLFHDWFQPVTILSAVPLSIGGAFVAMLAFHFDLGLPPLMGLVMLLGIVTKNSILLVDFAVMAQRDHGLPLHDALIDACRKRARPIVMTTVAMVAGLLPLAFGFGGDASFRQPMAAAVIGGLVTSTALSLLVVPVAFTYITGLKQWLLSRRPETQAAPDSAGT